MNMYKNALIPLPVQSGWFWLSSTPGAEGCLWSFFWLHFHTNAKLIMMGKRSPVCLRSNFKIFWLMVRSAAHISELCAASLLVFSSLFPPLLPHFCFLLHNFSVCKSCLLEDFLETSKNCSETLFWMLQGKEWKLVVLQTFSPAKFQMFEDWLKIFSFP